jgi:phosphonopyruvate decarboxylase
MPVCSGHLPLSALASAAGYRAVLEPDGEAPLREALDRIAGRPGPILIAVRCACGARADLGRPTTTPIQNRDAFMSFLK